MGITNSQFLNPDRGDDCVPAEIFVREEPEEEEDDDDNNSGEDGNRDKQGDDEGYSE